LNGALLEATDLTEANLEHADVAHPVPHRACLAGARMADATFGRTVIADCPTLAAAVGLEVTSHLAPSSIGIGMLSQILGRLPPTFIDGLGITKALLQTSAR
jgi:hypothetical protein